MHGRRPLRIGLERKLATICLEDEGDARGRVQREGKRPPAVDVHVDEYAAVLLHLVRHGRQRAVDVERERLRAPRQNGPDYRE